MREKANVSLEAVGYCMASLEWTDMRSQPVVYHGSPVPLEKFDNKKGGVFFTEDYYEATGFAGTPDNTYEGFLNFKKPLVVDAKGAKWDEINTPYGNSTQEVVSNAEKDGYDGIVFKNIIDNTFDDAEVGTPGNIYYAYKPEDAFVNESQLEDIWNKAQSELPMLTGKEFNRGYKAGANRVAKSTRGEKPKHKKGKGAK